MVTARPPYAVLLIVALVSMAVLLWSPLASAQDPARPNSVPAAPQPKAAQPPSQTKAQPKRGATPNSTAAPVGQAQHGRPQPPAGCGWIGKRVIQSLLRDDAVSAQDFDRLYRTFDCPAEHLRLAFDCTVVDGAPQTANEAQVRLEGCWNDPKFDIKSQKTQTSTTSSPPTTTPGASGPQPKGATSGKASSPVGSTPNYPKGK